MSIANWDKNEIKKLALVSGKPLEVQCAEAFLATGWKVRLGTFYHDIASEKIRELDVLAERRCSFQAKGADGALVQWRLCLRILGSCKGFAPDHGPATYSVLANSPSVEKPCFMCYNTQPRGLGFVNSMRKQSAERFLHLAGLSSAQQIVGFDILQRRKDHKRPPMVEYVRKTDRDLYEGLDSAIKAAIFWYQEEEQEGNNRSVENECFIALNLPVLVSSLPFWDVSFDRGKPGEPELKSCGFHVGLYPSGNYATPLQPMTSILWEVAKLDELTRNLNDLFEFIVDEAKEAAKDS